MKEIKIGGYTVAELQKMQKLIQKDASKVIAEAVESGKANVEAIKALYEAHDDYSEVDEGVVRKLAEDATEALKLAELISGISGVEYFLEYNEPYDGGNTLSDELEEIFEYEYPSGVDGLMDILQSMEQQSFQWNSSSIGC